MLSLYWAIFLRVNEWKICFSLRNYNQFFILFLYLILNLKYILKKNTYKNYIYCEQILFYWWIYQYILDEASCLYNIEVTYQMRFNQIFSICDKNLHRDFIVFNQLLLPTKYLTVVAIFIYYFISFCICKPKIMQNIL